MSNQSIGQDGAQGWPGYMPTSFNPNNVNLSMVAGNDDFVREVVCYIESGENDYAGSIGVRISSVFVILIVSSAVTFFPVLATKVPKLKIPLYVYLFARYFGAGVIVATAFIHLLDPAYEEIGPSTCVGMTGGWRSYSWPPAIALTSSVLVFLMDFCAERYVEKKYGLKHGATDGAAGRIREASVDAAMMRYQGNRQQSVHAGHQHLHSGEQDNTMHRARAPSVDEAPPAHVNPKAVEEGRSSSPDTNYTDEKALDQVAEFAFRQQIAAFLILEFGILFHSVIIGLTLGSAGPDDFAVLYPVIVFHQSFEGMGLGARLSAIPFPRRLRWMPWALCAGYGLTTPIAIAAGLGVRTTYNSGSFTANVVSGVLDATSAGILIYTGFVELLARDFLFNPDRTDDDKQLAFMVISVLLGAGIMALLGKWA